MLSLMPRWYSLLIKMSHGWETTKGILHKAKHYPLSSWMIQYCYLCQRAAACSLHRAIKTCCYTRQKKACKGWYKWKAVVCTLTLYQHAECSMPCTVAAKCGCPGMLWSQQVGGLLRCHHWLRKEWRTTKCCYGVYHRKKKLCLKIFFHVSTYL